jgi:hypothetical protein
MTIRPRGHPRCGLLNLILLLVNTQSLISNANALSVYSLKGRYDSLTSLRLKIRNTLPGSDFFPGEGPYVPSGLSDAEYQKLKKDEAAKLKSMKYGAWGPRFKPSDAPGGDWMVVPRLWTNGFSVQESSGPSRGGNPDKNSMGRLAMFLRKNGPGFLMAFILVDAMTTAVAMYKATELSLRQAIAMILKFGLFKRKSFYAMSFVKTHAAKITAAMVLTPIMCLIIEWMNRRKLWMTRRTILTEVVGAFGFLMIWARLLCLASTLF